MVVMVVVVVVLLPWSMVMVVIVLAVGVPSATPVHGLLNESLAWTSDDGRPASQF